MDIIDKSAKAIIRDFLGLSDELADALMPGGDISPAGFPSLVVYPPDPDEKPWAVQEHERDMKRYGDRPI